MRLFKNRKYKSGTGWCIWRWTGVDSKYIVRLHLLKTPWFAICLHWIMKPDAEPWLHDHPVSFLSIILRGKYAEARQRAHGHLGIAVHRWFNFVRASRADRHRIIFTRKNTLTLCLMGPKTREWGFHTDDGWIMWKDYYKAQRAIGPPLTAKGPLISQAARKERVRRFAERERAAQNVVVDFDTERLK